MTRKTHCSQALLLWSLRRLTFKWSREIQREQRDEVLHRKTGATWGDRDSKMNEGSGMPVTYCWVPLPSALWEHYASTSICDMAFWINVPGWKIGHHTDPAVGIPGPLQILSRDIWKREHDWTAVRVPHILFEVQEKEEAVDATVSMN